ncbi:MAG TPA: gamma-glutamyltransferase [Verrucomicrobiales bacterium]|nr:gamma-glutamyltransferase [Verrucomicrobiales bacterium]
MNRLLKWTGVFMLGSVLAAHGEITRRGDKSAAVTVHELATQAAMKAFRNGGNAVDAAIAAGLMLGVVDGFNSGVGGGCFMLVRSPDGKVTAFDGREIAGAAATRDMFVRNGKADVRLSQTGALAAGVPGSLAAYDAAAKKFGRLPLARALEGAADLAETGFEISGNYAARLRSASNEMAEFPATKAVFLTESGTALSKGTVLKQVDLAKSYRSMAKEGIGWFYGGPFAAATEKWMKENGGILTAQDFKGYRMVVREPLRSSYRGYEVIGFPPPSSGGVHVAQILNMLATRGAGMVRTGSVEDVHFTAEAMKLAFADRAFWLGDPDFVKVPRGLADAEYAKGLAAKIDPLKTTTVSGYGTPENAATDIFGKHTTHFSMADAEGWWVACTATVNTTFGSKVVVPGTGIVLNNQMDDFSIQPGVRNAFGLVGAEANAVEPGKRPLSSMAPTLVLKDGQPVLSVGAAGGPTIISQVLLAVVGVIDGGMTLDKALAAPRIHHQWSPDVLKIEKSAGKEVIEELKRRGHRVEVTDEMGACNGIMRLSDGTLMAAGDGRVPGVAEAE